MNYVEKVPLLKLKITIFILNKKIFFFKNK